MLKRKFTALFLAVLTILSISVLPVSASFGSGVGVIAENLCLIKSGGRGERLRFCDSDFKAALGVADFGEIKLVTLPKSSEGTLTLRGKRAKVGDTVRRRNIPTLVFLPASGEVGEARFSFTVSALADGRVIECIMKFTSEKNRAPIADESTSTVRTESGSLSGVLTASDPDGDSLEFLVARYPEHGALRLDTDGGYSYTPKKGFRGKDSFSYVVRDEYGNYSSVATVRLRGE